MGKESKKWINKETFEKITPGDRLNIRYMNGIAIVQEQPDVEKETIDVTFEGGAWNGRTINLIRQQIERIL